MGATAKTVHPLRLLHPWFFLPTSANSSPSSRGLWLATRSPAHTFPAFFPPHEQSQLENLSKAPLPVSCSFVHPHWLLCLRSHNSFTWPSLGLQSTNSSFLVSFLSLSHSNKCSPTPIPNHIPVKLRPAILLPHCATYYLFLIFCCMTPEHPLDEVFSCFKILQHLHCCVLI